MDLDVGCFIMVCTSKTESECLERKLFGTTDNEKSRKDLAKITKGDIGFLFNFETETLFGVFKAQSEIGKHVGDAWGGKYPRQLRIESIGEIQAVNKATELLKQAGTDFKNNNYPWVIQNKDVAEKLLQHFHDNPIHPRKSENFPNNSYYLGEQEQPSESQCEYLSDYFYTKYNWQEFERITATLFNILGFQTVFKGHRNSGERVADFLCYSPLYIEQKQRICLVVDAKSRDNYFVNTADERAMKEYISEQKAIIKQKQGILQENTFFIFIAKSFDNGIESKISEISRETESCGAVIRHDTLLLMVERRLRLGYRFHLEVFSKLIKNKEITFVDIRNLYSQDSSTF